MVRTQHIVCIAALNINPWLLPSGSEATDHPSIVFFFSVGLRPFYLAPLFDPIPRIPTPLECPFCSKTTSRGGSHISLWMPLQRELRASGEILSLTFTRMCTLKNCSNHSKQRRHKRMKALLLISSSLKTVTCTVQQLISFVHCKIHGFETMKLVIHLLSGIWMSLQLSWFCSVSLLTQDLQGQLSTCI